VSITREELEALPEYSCSIPTGTTIGKRWRRDVAFNDPNPKASRDWMIAEYIDCACRTNKRIGISWAWAMDPATGEVHRGGDGDGWKRA
jgi:hypothetical protein